MKKLKLATIITIISISLVGCGKSQVSNNNNNNVNNGSTRTNISQEQAKEIALKHAGLTSDEVSFVEAESDIDNGVEKYNIEFYHGDKEYDYEINSANGEILKYDYDIEYNNNDNVNNGSITTNISQEQAKEIALKHAGLASNQVSLKRIELDFDNGIQIYEVEFYYNNREYSYEIDANTGEILSYEQD